jgi:hypothetical protein
MSNIENLKVKLVQAFNLTDEELAQIMCRKAFEEDHIRLAKLDSVVNEWINAGFKAYSDDVIQPLYRDRCLLDALRQSKIDADMIMFMGSRLNTMSDTRSAVQIEEVFV